MVVKKTKKTISKKRKSPRVVNRLSRRDARLLESWLEQSWDDIVTAGATKDDVAKAASDKLGFDVRASNVQGACMAIDKQWKSDRNGTIDLTVIFKRLNRIEKKIDAWT